MLPLVSELIDGALDADATWKVRMHLSVCPKCAAAAREFEASTKLMKSLPKRDVSENFDAALAARIAKLGPMPAPRRGLAAVWQFRSPAARMRLVAAPAAIALVGLATIGFYGLRPPTHSGSVPAAHATAVSDNALLATCMRQHHSYVASDPLADPSAQTLASQIDASVSANPRPGGATDLENL